MRRHGFKTLLEQDRFKRVQVCLDKSVDGVEVVHEISVVLRLR